MRFGIWNTRGGEDSDSDESFHCYGQPQDLNDGWQAEVAAPPHDANVVYLPDDEEYYSYSAGLARAARGLQRTPIPRRFDSDRTGIGSPPLIIRTGRRAMPSPPPAQSGTRGYFGDATEPRMNSERMGQTPQHLTSRYASRARNATDHAPRLQEAEPIFHSAPLREARHPVYYNAPPFPEAQSAAIETARPSRWSPRRRGMLLDINTQTTPYSISRGRVRDRPPVSPTPLYSTSRSRVRVQRPISPTPLYSTSRNRVRVQPAAFDTAPSRPSQRRGGMLVDPNSLPEQLRQLADRDDDYDDYVSDYYGSNYCGRNDYGRDDYGRNEHGRNDYGRNDYGRNDYGRNDYGRSEYGRNGYGSNYY